MADFIHPSYPGGRILLRAGRVDVGAVFPPCGEGQDRHPWVWRFWGRYGTAPDGRAKTELAAKTALLAQWSDYLRAAGLVEIKREEHAND